MLWAIPQFAHFDTVALFGISIHFAALIYLTVIDVYRRELKKNEASLLAHTSTQTYVYSSTPSSPHSTSFDGVKINSWRPIVAQVDGYNILTKFLREEFSSENLLFLTEYAQFKSALIEICPDEMKSLEEDLPWMLTLPMHQNEKGATTGTHAVPIGTITKEFRLHMKNVDVASTDYSAYLNAYCRLSDKYIDNSAEFQINISSLQRQNILSVAKDVESLIDEGNLIADTLPYFEEAALAIEGLMNDSFSRFRRTDVTYTTF